MMKWLIMVGVVGEDREYSRRTILRKGKRRDFCNRRTILRKGKRRDFCSMKG